MRLWLLYCTLMTTNVLTLQLGLQKHQDCQTSSTNIFVQYMLCKGIKPPRHRTNSIPTCSSFCRLLSFNMKYHLLKVDNEAKQDKPLLNETWPLHHVLHHSFRQVFHLECHRPFSWVQSKLQTSAENSIQNHNPLHLHHAKMSIANQAIDYVGYKRNAWWDEVPDLMIDDTWNRTPLTYFIHLIR